MRIKYRRCNYAFEIPRSYAKMVKGDREMRLKGYEVYRFGGYEFMDLK